MTNNEYLIGLLMESAEILEESAGANGFYKRKSIEKARSSAKKALYYKNKVHQYKTLEKAGIPVPRNTKRYAEDGYNLHSYVFSLANNDKKKYETNPNKVIYGLTKEDKNNCARLNAQESKKILERISKKHNKLSDKQKSLHSIINRLGEKEKAGKLKSLKERENFRDGSKLNVFDLLYKQNIDE